MSSLRFTLTKSTRRHFELLFLQTSLFRENIHFFKHCTITTWCACFMSASLIFGRPHIILHPLILDLVCTICLWAVLLSYLCSSILQINFIDFNIITSQRNLNKCRLLVASLLTLIMFLTTFRLNNIDYLFSWNQLLLNLRLYFMIHWLITR
jgi:hypothetical protein